MELAGKFDLVLANVWSIMSAHVIPMTANSLVRVQTHPWMHIPCAQDFPTRASIASSWLKRRRMSCVFEGATFALHKHRTSAHDRNEFLRIGQQIQKGSHCDHPFLNVSEAIAFVQDCQCFRFRERNRISDKKRQRERERERESDQSTT